MELSEKMEKNLKMALNIFVAVAVVVVVLCFWSSSKYSPNDHSIEQGHLPVYVTPPDGSGTQTNNSTNNSTTTEPEDFFANFDVNMYSEFNYENILNACTTNSNKHIKLKGTVYSVLKTSSSVIYSLADDDGNYYSVVDQSKGQLASFKRSDVVIVYGVPCGLSKMNNQDVPQLEAAFLEESL